jgi:hypothetical protein
MRTVPNRIGLNDDGYVAEAIVNGKVVRLSVIIEGDIEFLNINGDGILFIIPFAANNINIFVRRNIIVE